MITVEQEASPWGPQPAHDLGLEPASRSPMLSQEGQKKQERAQKARRGPSLFGRGYMCIASGGELGLGPSLGIPEHAQRISKSQIHLPLFPWREA